MPISIGPLGLLVEILKRLYPPLATRIGYLKDIHRNSEILGRKRDDLHHKLNDLEREVQRGKAQGKIPTDDANGWLDDARMLIDCSPWLIEEANQSNQRGCFSVWCLSCRTSYKLGKKISETTDRANELLARTIEPPVVDPLPQMVLPFPTPTIKENTSAAVIKARILTYLADADTGTIGVWGKRGMGKSTILKNIYNQFEGTSDFSTIILVKFTHDGSLKKLRRGIAAELSLDLSQEEDEDRQSRLLLKEFNKRERFLLMLDDVPEVVNLRALGVPDPKRQKFCKIVVATEKREICSSMAVDVEIEIDPLQQDEAWELFSDKLGHIPPEIDEIARVVCHECSGRVGLLVSFGAALRHRPRFVWERALRILKSPESQLIEPEKLAATIVEVPRDQLQKSLEEASVEKLINKILNYLADSKVRRIGIWGMGGVGKTRIVRDNIYLKLKEKSSFDVVIYAIASRKLSMKKLRRDIAKEIDCELQDEEDERKAAMLLLMELTKIKFLLILDDLWDIVNFEELGVPYEQTMQNGSKILFASRRRDVCAGMLADIEVPVKSLPRKEAWALFQERVGNIKLDIEKIARDVCEECDGLPLALITIGAAMRNKVHLPIWRQALRVLKSSEFKLTRMEEGVFRILKFSYEMLPTENHRNCFLYCSLFPEDHTIEIDKLIEYWIMEGFIDDFNNRRENLIEAYDDGYGILENLLDSCLLERNDNWKDCVKMHDMIRDTAIKITKEDEETGRRFVVKPGAGLEECIPANEMEKKDKISLMENDINCLVEQPNCPELLTLLLNGNDPMIEVPQMFFCSMVSLRVLDLSETSIKSLPKSISHLANLTSLILRCCFSLRSLDYVGGLKNLQFLDLEEAGIWELSEEIGNLKNLLRLNLSRTSNLRRLPENAISQMALLEDLQTKQSFIWKHRGYSKFLIAELQNLRHLSSFSLEIGNEQEADLLSISCKWKNIKNFCIRVGCPDPTMDTYYFKNIQKVILPERNGRCLDITNTDPTSAAGIIKNSEKLCLYNVHFIQTLSQLGRSNLINLKECWVSECDMLKAVVDEAKMEMLPALEILVLRNLINILFVWDGNITPSSFGRFRSITIYWCPNLKYLFSITVLNQLQCLEELKVVNCEFIETLAHGNSNSVSAHKNCMNKLRYILLLNLPYLKMLWNGIYQMPSLEVVEVAKCRNLLRVPITKSLAPKLQVMCGDEKFVQGTCFYLTHVSTSNSEPHSDQVRLEVKGYPWNIDEENVDFYGNLK